MKNLKKVIFILIILFISFVLVIAFVGPKLIKPEKIKERVIGIVKEKFHYDMEIDSLRFSLFLKVKARLDGVKLKPLVESENKFNMEAKTVEASLELIPLLRREIKIGKILLDEPVIILEVEKAKMEVTPQIDSKTSPAIEEPEKASSKNLLESIFISGLVIRKGKITVESKTLLPEGVRALEASDITLFTAPLSLDKPMKVSVQCIFEKSPIQFSGIVTPVKRFSNIVDIIQQGRIKMGNLDIRALSPYVTRYIPLTFTSGFLAGDLELNKIGDRDLVSSGKIGLSNLLINKTDGKVFFLKPIDISLDENVKIEEKGLTIENLKLDVESISIYLSGSLRHPLLEAKISTGTINLDSLKDFLNLHPRNMSGTLNFEGALSGPLDKYSTDNLKGTLELKEAEFSEFIPNTIFKMTGKLDFTASSILKEALSGKLQKAELKSKVNLLLSQGTFNKIVFQDLSSELNYVSNNNMVELSPVEFSLYGGRFNGVIKATMGQEPEFSFGAEVKDIKVNSLLADTTTMTDTIYGNLYSQLELKGKGKDFPTITQTMMGNMHLEMRDGKITTLNLLRDILTVAGLLTGVHPPEGDYTRIDLLTADVVVAEGKATTTNLSLSSKGLEVVGKGYFSFDQRLNFIMDAYLGTLEELKGAGGGISRFMKDKYGRLIIPIKVSGTVSKPRVSLDTERLAVNIIDQQIKDFLPKIFK